MMRYSDRVRGIPVDDGDPYGPKALAAADDLSDLTADDYATAAATLAREAVQPQESGSEGNSEPENIEQPGETFADAFTPAGPEPEVSARDERYREQLRESEADRDKLRGLLESAQRAEIARLASPMLADPADLYRDNVSVADLLDDNGSVDPAKVDSAVSGVLEQHAHWASSRAVFRGELRSGATARLIAPTAPSFRDAFAPATE
jgi:hypothetical protein